MTVDAPRASPREAHPGPAVVIEGLSKTYVPSPPFMRVLLRSAIKEPVNALQDVSLQVAPGEICAIVGPNGAGKSTLFRILTGLTTPTTGSASILGFDVDRESFEVRKRIGLHSGDEKMLLGRHSVVENLMFHGRLQGIPEKRLKRRSREVLELVGIERAASRLALALSSGMKARLQLARALLHRPHVLILDEPTGSLDPVAAYQFLEVLREAAREQNIATLISSHRLEEIEALPDHVLLLNEGRVVYDGDLNQLRHHWAEPRFEIRFTSSTAAQEGAAYLGSMEGVAVAEVDDDTVVVRTELTVGTLMAGAGSHLEQMVALSATRLPLRDLLAEILAPTGR